MAAMRRIASSARGRRTLRAKAHRPFPRTVRLVAAGLATLFIATQAHALDPVRSMSQFHRTSWSMQDGMPGNLNSIAQTPDGFLWLGSAAGLYRFDGVRAERFGASQLP